MTRPEVLGLSPAHVATAGSLLGRAFVDNPGYLCTLGHLGARRLAAVTRIKTAFTRAALRFGEAEGAYLEGRLVGASLVCAPGQFPPHLLAMVEQARAIVPLGVRALRNFLHMDRFMRRHHPKQPHYYLFVLGVEPELQGRGIGKALLGSLNRRADARRLPCYLETDKATSVKLYESVGYEVVHHHVVREVNDLELWTMLRPALTR